YSVELSDGSALPGWLSFDAAARTLSGTPINSDVGAIDVLITATDTSGVTVSDVFRLTVSNVNNVPTVAVALLDAAATEGVAFTYIVPASSFTDIDASDALIYSATLSDGSALPSWLSFDAATRTF